MAGIRELAVPGAVVNQATGGLGGQLAGTPGSGESMGAQLVGAARNGNIFPGSVKEVTDYWGVTGPDANATGGIGVEPPIDAGGGTDRTGTDDENRSLIAEALFRQNDQAQKAPPAYYEPEGQTYTPTGGKQLYDEAFTHAPARRAEALRGEAEVVAQHSGALERHYQQQAALDAQAAQAIQARRAHDAEEIAQRQQSLDKATQFYSQDLADQGKFWHNPGNMLAAITYSLMPIFSNDPNIGIKTINQAIDRDMEVRRHTAESTLGALRSNLSGYQKIAGDREAGELLAQAEAHRMAAQEIQRISAKFDGPLAKKKAEVMIADQETRASALQMEFYNRYNHINPTKMDVGLHNARAQGGPNGWQQLGAGGVAGPNAAAVGEVKGTHTTATTDKGYSNAVSPAQAAVLRVGGAPVLEKVIENKAMSDSDVDVAIKRLAMAEAQRKYHGAPGAWEKYLDEQDKMVAPVAVELTKKATSRALVSGLRSQLDIVAKSEAQDGRDVEDFISWSRKNLPQSWLNQYDQLTAKTRQGDMRAAEQQAMMRAQAGRRMQSRIVATINQHKHDLLGGAQSEQELASFNKEINEKSPIGDLQSWLTIRDGALKREYDQSIAGLPPLARVLIRKRMNYGNNMGHVPTPGVPAPARAPAPPLEGQVSGPGRIGPPSAISPNAVDSDAGIVNTGRPR